MKIQMMTRELFEKLDEEVASMPYELRFNADTWGKAFAIFGKYGKDNRIEIAASHDLIYVGPYGAIDGFGIDEEDARYLISAGWCFGDEEWCRGV
jgi:hypothetical protein